MADDPTSVTREQTMLLDEDVAFNIVLEKVILRKRVMATPPGKSRNTTIEKTKEGKLGG